MNYKVHDSKRGKCFASLAEANAYCNLILRETGIVLTVTETRGKVTHTYKEANNEHSEA